ncbi:MAG: hypothetical protein JNL58_10290 [Planctomyces sp.]|nr:hypothetical protein [Planctomyces sp.]
MKIEECIVTVERRSLGGCIDLAFVFCREFAGPIFRQWLIFAIPSCLAVFLLSSFSFAMLLPSILIFMFFSTFFAGTLVSSIGPQVFGVPMSARASIRTLRSRIWSYLAYSTLLRMLQFFLGACLCYTTVPALFVTALLGHLPEVILLEQSKMDNVMKRLNWLSRGGGYSRYLGRLFVLMFLWIIFSFGLFIIIELLAYTLFNVPIFFTKIPTDLSVDFSERLTSLTHDDPLFLTSLHLSIWLPYPLLRLAWFFCYLDQRIRNECWDLDLQFRAEANRLEGLT